MTEPKALSADLASSPGYSCIRHHSSDFPHHLTNRLSRIGSTRPLTISLPQKPLALLPTHLTAVWSFWAPVQVKRPSWRLPWSMPASWSLSYCPLVSYLGRRLAGISRVDCMRWSFAQDLWTRKLLRWCRLIELEKGPCVSRRSHRKVRSKEIQVGRASDWSDCRLQGEARLPHYRSVWHAACHLGGLWSPLDRHSTQPHFDLRSAISLSSGRILQ